VQYLTVSRRRFLRDSIGKGVNSLNFDIGDKVVYPNHGVGIIEQISNRTMGSTVERFYLLRIKSSGLKVMVPFRNIASVGLRRVVDNSEIQRIIEYLTDGECEDSHSDWKFRLRQNSGKMRTGSLMDVAVVLKSLLQLGQQKPLSIAEKKMLERTRYLLVSELSMARNSVETEVEDELRRVLAKSQLHFPEASDAAA
jgi:CarD family transcriptional regulator